MANFNVRNYYNSNGNLVPNHFIITTPKGAYFQSYQSVVAKIDKNNKVIVSSYWDYSQTTRKYLYNFLRMYGYNDLCSAKDMHQAIKDKQVILKKVESLNIV